MKKIDNTAKMVNPHTNDTLLITDEDGKQRDARPTDLIKLVVKDAPVKTMADANHGSRLLDLLRGDVGDVLELEEADYAWLLSTVKAAAPQLLGLVAQRFEDALQPMSVAERKEKRG